MSQPNLVPRGNGTGSLGTSDKKWSNIYAQSIAVDSGDYTGSFTGSFRGDGSALLGIVASVVEPIYIDFNTGASEPDYREGRVYWDNVEKTLTLMNDQEDVRLQIGEESYVRAVNKSGTTITNGTPVKISGSQGNRPVVWPAQATEHIFNEVHREYELVGLATHDILNNQEGFITTFGIVGGIDTSNYTVGHTLYVSSSEGELTDQKPAAPLDILRVGVVLSSHQTQGKVFVNPQEAVHVNDITGMVVSGTVEDNAAWVYDVASNTFSPRTLQQTDIRVNRTAVTTNSYTPTANDVIVGVKYTATGSVTIQLDLIDNVPYANYVIKDEGNNASVNNITILASGSNLVEHESSVIIAQDKFSINLYHDGDNNWYIY